MANLADQSESSPVRRPLAVFVVLAALSIVASEVGAQERAPLQWSVTPYLWATHTSFDLRLRDQALGSGELSFSDLLDITDESVMVNVEAGRGQWSVLADVTYLETSAIQDRALLTVHTRSKQSFIDVAAAFWPGGVGSSLSLVGGLRSTGFDDRYQFRLNQQLLSERRSTDDYLDVLLGVRYRFELSDRWSLQTEGNVSFGDSEGTFLARAFLAVALGSRDRYEVLFGYQYKEAEFVSGDLKTEFVYDGPGAGFSFRF